MKILKKKKEKTKMDPTVQPLPSTLLTSLRSEDGFVRPVPNTKGSVHVTSDTGLSSFFFLMIKRLKKCLTYFV